MFPTLLPRLGSRVETKEFLELRHELRVSFRARAPAVTIRPYGEELILKFTDSLECGGGRLVMAFELGVQIFDVATKRKLHLVSIRAFWFPSSRRLAADDLRGASRYCVVQHILLGLIDTPCVATGDPSSLPLLPRPQGRHRPLGANLYTKQDNTMEIR